MLSALLLLAFCFSGAVTGETHCDIDAETLGARYAVTRSHGDSDSDATTRHHVQIWRSAKQVAYIHEEREITEIWDLVSDGRQKLVRYFDAYNRAIEYQPEDVDSASGDEAWSARFHIVSNEQRKAMQQLETSGNGCDRVEHYRAAAGDGQELVEVDWWPEHQLVERIKRIDGNETMTWQLDKVFSDPSKVAAELSKRHGYQTTDFVDIGDNESDPFLLKMMNLGFIEHDHMH